MTVVWMWKNYVQYRANIFAILFLLYSLQTLNLQIIAHASSSIKTTNIYQTLGRVFHHKPSTLNCIGLCSAIMRALF